MIINFSDKKQTVAIKSEKEKHFNLLFDTGSSNFNQSRTTDTITNITVSAYSGVILSEKDDTVIIKL